MTEYTSGTLRALANSILRGDPFHEHFYAENLRGCAHAWATERKQVCQFIRDMYTGRFAKREQDYWTLPQWIRDAIEADPIYHEEPE